MANNQYKFFRQVSDNPIIGPPTFENFLAGSVNNEKLEKRYDEPTYLTFKVLFGENSGIWSGTNLLNTSYDRMPHPLFINQQVDSTQTEGQSGRVEVSFDRETYSTIDYLRDSNEFTRAEMLKEFIQTWEYLQKNMQWYFQSVTGLNDILKIVPERGKRVSQENKLTFNMLEGLDMKISYLLNLYKKIAWDDIYQRWILPDMMRFFDIQLFITEYRTFHQSMVNPNSNDPVYLQILNGKFPTYLITFEMCEFDINSFLFSYRDNLSIGEEPQQATVSFDVKIGNLNEIQLYPLFQHFYFDDYKLNGMDRSKEKGIIKDINGRVVNAIENNLIKEQQYASTKSGDRRYSSLDQQAKDTFFQRDHTSGNPYIETNLTNNIRNSSRNYSIDVNNVDPLEPATWAGNAIKFGKSFTTNFITSKVDKAKMTKIPGLGFSFNDAVSAIQSKDFTSVLALVRRSLNQSIGIAEPPSALLDKKIDDTFKDFLLGLSQSEATDNDELEFIKFANLALSDNGLFTQIKDLSKATNLIGPNEINKPVKIEGKNGFKSFIAAQTGNDRSKATDLDGEVTLINTGKFSGNNTISDATTTNKKDLESKHILQGGDKSKATDLDGEPIFVVTGKIIEAKPSSQLNNKIQ